MFMTRTVEQKPAPDSGLASSSRAEGLAHSVQCYSGPSYSVDASGAMWHAVQWSSALTTTCVDGLVVAGSPAWEGGGCVNVMRCVVLLSIAS